MGAFVSVVRKEREKSFFFFASSDGCSVIEKREREKKKNKGEKLASSSSSSSMYFFFLFVNLHSLALFFTLQNPFDSPPFHVDMFRMSCSWLQEQRIERKGADARVSSANRSKKEEREQAKKKSKQRRPKFFFLSKLERFRAGIRRRRARRNSTETTNESVPDTPIADREKEAIVTQKRGEAKENLDVSKEKKEREKKL